MTSLYEHTLAQDDPFEYTYECISGQHGKDAMDIMLTLYNDIAIDFYKHPDDDFEQIIEIMLEQMENL